MLLETPPHDSGADRCLLTTAVHCAIQFFTFSTCGGLRFVRDGGVMAAAGLLSFLNTGLKNQAGYKVVLVFFRPRLRKRQAIQSLLLIVLFCHRTFRANPPSLLGGPRSQGFNPTPFQPPPVHALRAHHAGGSAARGSPRLANVHGISPTHPLALSATKKNKNKKQIGIIRTAEIPSTSRTEQPPEEITINREPGTHQH